jgi:hypothetical protein
MGQSDPASPLMAPFCGLGMHDHPSQALPWDGVYNKVLFLDRVTGSALELARIERSARLPESQFTRVGPGRFSCGDRGPATGLDPLHREMRKT